MSAGSPLIQSGGRARPGATRSRAIPEGAVAAHIEEVLNNGDDVAVDERDRERLRLVALKHDTFKYRVVRGQTRTGGNHHAMIARRFAERYVGPDRVTIEWRQR